MLHLIRNSDPTHEVAAEHLAFWGRESTESTEIKECRGVPYAFKGRLNGQGLAVREIVSDDRGLAAYQYSGSRLRTPWKRAFDFLAAILIIAIISPLLLGVFLYLKLTEKGPAIFCQLRVGFQGKLFPSYKFRTMVPEAEKLLDAFLESNPDAAREWAATRKLKDDPRVTHIGKFLRVSSIDELPQIFNVIRGEMSLVGPRPIMPVELRKYGLNVIYYLRERPGISGLWQVSGRSSTTYDERVRFDRIYSIKRNFWYDLSILLRTVPAVLKARGAV